MSKNIAANVEALLNTIESRLETAGKTFASVYVKTTMGPAVEVLM